MSKWVMEKSQTRWNQSPIAGVQNVAMRLQMLLIHSRSGRVSSRGSSGTCSIGGFYHNRWQFVHEGLRERHS